MDASRVQTHSELPLAAMTVDVEEYFQVAAFDDVVSINEWGNFQSRIESQIDLILQLFEEKSMRGTFFILGSVAELHPQIVKKIASNGHEIASHGHMHQKVDRQNVTEFRHDLLKSKNTLEDIIGKAVYGYRAPSFSINKTNEWAFEVLREVGFIYSSSTYPIQHDHYGTPDWPKNPYEPLEGILELPQSTIELFGRTVPAGGGGYFRMLPYAMSRWAIKKHQREKRHPYMFYFHPWEIDPSQPRVEGARLKSTFRHYVNQGRMMEKVAKLSEVAKWVSVMDAFNVRVKHKQSNSIKVSL